jgi:hypothetical protein
MSELPGPPDLEAKAEAEADGLIASQYSDRPQLRPVLDAVLAALPALGPVTVQARKTFISLVTPRRTFAVVQPIPLRRLPGSGRRSWASSAPRSPPTWTAPFPTPRPWKDQHHDEHRQGERLRDSDGPAEAGLGQGRAQL